MIVPKSRNCRIEQDGLDWSGVRGREHVQVLEVSSWDTLGYSSILCGVLITARQAGISKSEHLLSSSGFYSSELFPICFTMHSSETQLMDLPCLPFRQVVDELVNSLGLRKILTLRLVNGT